MQSKEINKNREISWLHFNERVLQEAADAENPLINRIRFLGIYSNNLDEFFRVRVATVTRMLISTQQAQLPGHSTLSETLDEIKKNEKVMQRKFNCIYTNLVEELKQHQIFLINEGQLNEKQGHFVKEYFRDLVRPNIFPIMFESLNSQVLHDHALYMLISLKSNTTDISDNAAIIEVPTDIQSRFVLLPSNGGEQHIIFLDDIIRYCLDQVFDFLGYNTYEAFAIKFTRDAELDIDSDVSKSFIELMTQSLKQREKAFPIRVVYDKNIPKTLLKELFKKFAINPLDTISPGGRYHNLKDLMSFPNVGGKNLEFPVKHPLPNPQLIGVKSIINTMKENDILLNFPYQSFEYIIDLLREASIDPHVRSIKMTLYRVAQSSNVVNALINAVRNGKKVTVFLEVQARFDEYANIRWASEMQNEGVKVIQSIPGYKVHAKLLVIRRKEKNENVYYAGLGTGNFNETTSKIYTDTMLLTANKEVTADVNDTFKLFEARYKMPKFKTLILSPFKMRTHFIKLINKEIENAKLGKEAWITLKLNSLVDKAIIKKLYQASDSGVRINMIVRGICILKPGVKGLSENITGVSIVGRFLEHSRILVFANAGNPIYYISSADWMERNFDHRIEIAVPIKDENLKKELKKLLDIQLSDNMKARVIGSNNKYVKTNSKTKIDSQSEIYNYFRKQVIPI